MPVQLAPIVIDYKDRQAPNGTWRKYGTARHECEGQEAHWNADRRYHPWEEEALPIAQNYLNQRLQSLYTTQEIDQQSVAVQQQLNSLKADIKVLSDANDTLSKRVTELEKKLGMSKTSANRSTTETTVRSEDS